MNLKRQIFLYALVVSGLASAWTGCVGVAARGQVGYGGGPWFNDGGWLDGGGRGWYGGHGGGAYVHPGGGGHPGNRR